jgi:hypothetical protein
MTERDAGEEADRLERVRAVLRQQFQEELFTPFPWFDATRPYGFFADEQMRVLDAREWPSARPVLSLEEFLRRRTLGK